MKMGVVKNKEQFAVMQELASLKKYISDASTFIDMQVIVDSFNEEGQISLTKLHYVKQTISFAKIRYNHRYHIHSTTV